MTTVAELLAECGRRGVVVTAVGDRLRVRGPVGAVKALRSVLIAHKPEIIAALARCPSCRQPTDDKRRCWHCHDRACERCGRQTGSAFIAHCVACGLTGMV
jgi:hypothetical protein